MLCGPAEAVRSGLAPKHSSVCFEYCLWEQIQTWRCQSARLLYAGVHLCGVGQAPLSGRRLFCIRGPGLNFFWKADALFAPVNHAAHGFYTSITSMSDTVAGPSRPAAGKQHICTYEGCGKSYAKPAKLAQHVRSHTGERPFVCTEAGCGASYMRNEHLKAHQRQHLDPKEKPFKCTQDLCDLAFWTSSQLKNHVQACHTDDADLISVNGQGGYTCTEAGCDKSFNKRKNLRLHIRQDHSGYTSDHDPESAAVTPFACTHAGCTMRFTTNAKRKLHLKVHQPNRYTCAMVHTEPQDGFEFVPASSYIYTFSTWSALQAHIRADHPKVCSWPGCDKKFFRQDSLRSHYRRHEARKLRLELELRTLEMSQEAQFNHRRAGLTDDSDASSDEGSEFEQSDAAREEASDPNDALSPIPSTASPTLLSEQELILQASQLTARRPRRGGIFKDLHSAPQSAASTASASDDGLTSHRSGTTATGITAADVSLPITCSWNGCPKTYSSKGALSVHVRTAHLGEKPFECTGCGKRFAHKHLVTRHRRICAEKQAPEVSSESSRLRFSTTVDHEEDAVRADHDTESNSNVMEAVALPSVPQRHDIRTKLVDLLTGSGYASTATVPEASLKRTADDDSTAQPRKRATRDRIFDCPWNSIQTKLLSDSPPDSHLQNDGDTAEVTASRAAATSAPCDFRFKRIYDLRRHLQAHHGLALEDREIKAWFKLQDSIPSST